MMMKKLMMAMVLGAAFALQGALKDEIPNDYGLKVDLTSATQPGTALKNNTIYTVRGRTPCTPMRPKSKRGGKVSRFQGFKV